MVSGEFNSPILQEAEQEGYQMLRKPLEPARLHALLTQWGGRLRGVWHLLKHCLRTNNIKTLFNTHPVNRLF